MARRAGAALLGACLLANGSPAAAIGSVELAVKATYLYKVQSFVEWPEATASAPPGTFNLCVVGADPFGDVLDRAVAGQHVGDRLIAVLRFPAIPADSTCQTIYLSPGDPAAVARALKSTRDTPILTVTDGAGDSQTKGIINFVIVDNHVRLEIDNAAALASHLKISSKLLSIAVSVNSGASE